jgi:hypothetical protein
MKALKDFTTRLHRIRIDTTINEDADLSPHRFGDLVKRGFIGDDAPKPGKPKPKSKAG